MTAQGSYELSTDDLAVDFGDGTSKLVDSIRFRGLPTVRIVDRDIPFVDGVETGPDLLGGRVIDGKLYLQEDTPADTLASWEELAAIFVSETPVLFRFLRPGQSGWRRCYVRPRQLSEEPAGTFQVLRVPFELFAPDPVMYDDDLSTEVTNLGEATGGLGFPHGFPHGFGAASPGTIAAVNEGNKAVYPVALITAGVGGASALTIERQESSELLTWNGTLDAGQTLAIDFALQTVVLNGVASRLNNLTSFDFFRLRPGSNTVRFSGSGSATLSLAWRSGWAA